MWTTECLAINRTNEYISNIYLSIVLWIKDLKNHLFINFSIYINLILYIFNVIEYNILYTFYLSLTDQTDLWNRLNYWKFYLNVRIFIYSTMNNLIKQLNIIIKKFFVLVLLKFLTWKKYV